MNKIIGTEAQKLSREVRNEMGDLDWDNPHAIEKLLQTKYLLVESINQWTKKKKTVKIKDDFGSDQPIDLALAEEYFFNEGEKTWKIREAFKKYLELKQAELAEASKSKFWTKKNEREERIKELTEEIEEVKEAQEEILDFETFYWKVVGINGSLDARIEDIRKKFYEILKNVNYLSSLAKGDPELTKELKELKRLKGLKGLAEAVDLRLGKEVQILGWKCQDKDFQTFEKDKKLSELVEELREKKELKKPKPDRRQTTDTVPKQKEQATSPLRRKRFGSVSYGGEAEEATWRWESKADLRSWWVEWKENYENCIQRGAAKGKSKNTLYDDWKEQIKATDKIEEIQEVIQAVIIQATTQEKDLQIADYEVITSGLSKIWLLKDEQINQQGLERTAEVENEAEVVAVERDSALAEIEQKRTEIEELKGELSRVKGSQRVGEEEEKEWERLEAKLAAARRQVEERKQEVKKVRAEKESGEQEAKAKLAEKEGELAEKQQEVEKWETQVSRIKEMIENLQFELEQESQDHALTRWNLSRIENNLKEALVKVKQLEQEKLNREKIFEADYNRYKKLAQQYNELKKINEELGKKVVTLNGIIWDLVWENKLSKTENEKNLLESPVSARPGISLEAELAKAEEAKAKADLEAELATATSQIAELEAKLADWKGEEEIPAPSYEETLFVDSADDQLYVNKLQDERQDLINENARLTEKLEEKEAEISRLNQELNDFDEWISNQLDMSESREEVVRLENEQLKVNLTQANQQKIKDLENSLISLAKQKIKAQAKKEKIAAEKEKMSGNWAEVKFNLEMTNWGLEGQLTNKTSRIRELETEKEELQQHLDLAHNGIEELRIELANEKLVLGDFLDAQLRWYQNNFPKAYATVKETAEASGREVSVNDITSLIATQLQEEKEHLNAARTDIIGLKKKLQTAEENFAQVSQQNLTFQSQIREQEKLIEGMDEAGARQIEANILEREQTEQVKKKLQKSATQVAKLTHQVEELSKKFSASRWEKELLQEENTDLTQELANKNTKLSRISQERDKLRHKVHALRETSRIDREQWKESNDERDTEVRELENRIGTLGVELVRERVKNKRLTTLVKSKNKGCRNLEHKLEVQTGYNNSLLGTIATAQNHLGVADLTAITTYVLPPNQTLTDLITAYYANDLQKVIASLPELSHLDPDSSVDQVISTLRSLINKPPITVTDENLRSQLIQASATITRLEQQLQQKPAPDTPQSNPTVLDAPFGEDLTTIIQLELTSLTELFGQQVDTQTQQAIRNATNYAQVVAARQNFLAKHLKPITSQQAVVPKPTLRDSLVPKERIIWLILLLLLSSLVMKLRKTPKVKPKS